MNSEIDEVRRRYADRPTLLLANKLVSALLVRTRFYGTFDDFDEADSISAEAHAKRPDDPEAILLRAQVLNTLHEFGEARKLIDRLRESLSLPTEIPTRRLLPEEQRVYDLEATIDLATEDADTTALLRVRHALVNQRPSLKHINGLAAVYAKAGEYEKADELYARSVRNYRDVSPYPLASIAFTRGVMWSEMADQPAHGKKFYAEALEHLPLYVLANVHMAELDAAAGKKLEATERLEPLVSSTKEPEVLAALAKFHTDAEKAAAYKERADAAYRSLKKQHLNAFEHHHP